VGEQPEEEEGEGEGNGEDECEAVGRAVMWQVGSRRGSLWVVYESGDVLYCEVSEVLC
jgi:hypothetical protein